MIPVRFDYLSPATLDEALTLLAKRDGAAVVAGGQSLIPAMTVGRQAPAALVDIRHIGEVRGISALPDGGLRIGAAATLDEIASSDKVRSRFTALSEAAESAGDAAVRNRGTIGGGLAAGHPAGDLIVAVQALGGTINVARRRAKRTIAADKFVTGPYATALKAGEIITSVDLPAPEPGTGSAYVKLRHPGSGYAICAVAAAVTSGKGGKVSASRVAVTGAADRPARLSSVEGALKGKVAREAAAKAGASASKAKVEFASDTSASSDYRKHLAGVLAERAILLAAQRGGEA